MEGSDILLVILIVGVFVLDMVFQYLIGMAAILIIGIAFTFTTLTFEQLVTRLLWYLWYSGDISEILTKNILIWMLGHFILDISLIRKVKQITEEINQKIGIENK